MADIWTVDFPLPGVVGMLVRVLLLQEKLVLQEKRDSERWEYIGGHVSEASS
jgi:hypothetical protein